MTRRARLDAELVRRGLSASRSDAQEAIAEGRVTVKGALATRPTSLVARGEPIRVAPAQSSFASRGGIKLDRALARLDVPIAERKWLDAGASTGGFTDRLLQGGAAEVAAVDVGYGQLDWKLREDPRVTVLERTNVRNLTPDDLPWTPDGITADLSFISLALVLPALAGVAGHGVDLLLLVKPQFEVGRRNVGKNGVVRDPALWRYAIARVVVAAEQLGLGLLDVVPSELPGPAGNREFFVHLKRDASSDTTAIDRAVTEVAGEESPARHGPTAPMDFVDDRATRVLGPKTERDKEDG